ncbi:hypothetical protein PCIT_a1847 [Pseudoalteromonas citrea]|uniref:Major facilitator superfamily (MFS) profile domain-containing protein n=2 Tax=Pseudoalteromonas citrea TaxID=43655 RepID=A0AAD4AIS9_9GAMM|nr:MFS transporter [Pseudoalteromonas citrea]KAF7771888.1 hypothetical protein PCIT_a1847 [Pseudoalteromonas citrea]
MRELIQSKPFIAHWIGVLFTQLGSFFTLIALPWLVLEVSNNDPVILAIVLAAWGLPHSILLLVGGVLADRIGAVKLLIMSRVIFVVFTLIFACSLWLNFYSITWLAVSAFCLGCCSALGNPAAQSLLPRILPVSALLQANGVLMGSMQVSQVIGPMLAGVVIWQVKEVFSVSSLGSYDYFAVVFAIDAGLVFCGLCIFTRHFRWESVPLQTKQSISEALKFSVTYCTRHYNFKVVLGYLMLVSILLYGPLVTLIPLFAKTQLQLAEQGLSWLYAAQGIGAVCGAGLVMLIKPKHRHLGFYILIGDAIAACALWVLGSAAQSLWVMCIALLVMGVIAGFVMVAGMTWFQAHVEPKILGAIVGVVLFCVHGLIPLSAMFTGMLIKLFSIPELTTVLALCTGLLCCFGLLSKRIRRMGKVKELSV